MRLASRDRRVRPKASLPPGSRYESPIMLPLLSTKSGKIHAMIDMMSSV